MDIPVPLLLLMGVTLILGKEKCTGDPKSYNGLECATTTQYFDGHKGACGCGPEEGDNQYEWNKYMFTAAVNQAYFTSSNRIWCGEKCGQCIKLTTTGAFVPGHGSNVTEGVSKVFMITNFCPDTSPEESWCSQNFQNNLQNRFGYRLHFDLENEGDQLGSWGRGSNPEVTYEEVECDTADHEITPTDSMYRTCQCHIYRP